MAVELATAYVSLIPSMQGVQGAVTSGLAPVGPAAARAGDDAGRQAGRGISRGIGAAAGGIAALFAVDKIAGFFRAANAEAEDAQRVGKLTESIIRSTGGAANVTATDVGNLATKLSNLTGVDDEAIQSGANLLLTFKNVRNEAGEGANVFDRATAAAGDLAAAGFGSIDSGAKMLGKALNDPVAGLTALGKAGVTFTDQQKEQIAALVETGDVLGAQQIILQEVESQVGGAAAASASNADKVRVAWGNFQEMIGTMLLPALERMAGVGAAAFSWAAENQTAVMVIGAAVGILVTALIGYHVATLAAAGASQIATVATTLWSGATKLAAAGQWLLNAALTANPIGIVIAAIVLLVAAFVLAYQNSETFRELVQGAWNGIKAAAEAVGRWFTTTLPQWWSTVVASTRTKWAEVVGVFTNLRGQVSGALEAVWGVITSVFARTPLGMVVSNWGAIVDFIRGIPGKITSALGNLGDLLYNAGGNIIEGLARGIRGAVSKATSAVSNVMSAVRDFLPFSPAKKGPFSGRGWSGFSGQSVTADFAKGMLRNRDKLAGAAGATMSAAGLAGYAGAGSGVAGAGGRGAAGGDTIIIEGNVGWMPDELAREIKNERRDLNARHELSAIVGGI